MAEQFRTICPLHEGVVSTLLSHVTENQIGAQNVSADDRNQLKEENRLALYRALSEVVPGDPLTLGRHPAFSGLWIGLNQKEQFEILLQDRPDIPGINQRLDEVLRANVPQSAQAVLRSLTTPTQLTTRILRLSEVQIITLMESVEI